MNSLNEKHTKELQRKILERFNASVVFGSAMHNIFAEKEKEDLSKFKKHSINIPWYLKLFSKVITNIAYSSFKDGLSENCTDTVTIKRPVPYEVNNDNT